MTERDGVAERDFDFDSMIESMMERWKFKNVHESKKDKNGCIHEMLV